VEPDGAAGIALDEEFIVILAAFIADVQQDDGVAQGLLHTADADVGGAAGEVVGSCSTANGFIHRRRAEGAVYHYGVVTLAIALIVAAAQPFQPATEAFQVCDLCFAKKTHNREKINEK